MVGSGRESSEVSNFRCRFWEFSALRSVIRAGGETGTAQIKHVASVALKGLASAPTVARPSVHNLTQEVHAAERSVMSSASCYNGVYVMMFSMLCFVFF